MSENLPLQIQCLLQEKKEGRHYYLYNKKGNDYFEEICNSKEYYLTRCEIEVIDEQMEKFIEVLLEKGEGEEFNIVELGCGNGAKAMKIIERLLSKGYSHFTYWGVDYSEEMLVDFRKQVEPLVEQLKGVQVATSQGLNNHVVERLFKDNKAQLQGLPTLVVQLGGSLGNEDTNNNILTLMDAHSSPNDALLVTFDLIKDLQLLEASYNNLPNEKFIKNYLNTLNEDLGANFDLEQFHYVSAWDYRKYQMSHYLQSKVDQIVHFPHHNINIHFFQNENLRVSRSKKYNLPIIQKMAQHNGLKIIADIQDSKKYISFIMFNKI